jgi:hypothetical protein
MIALWGTVEHCNKIAGVLGAAIPSARASNIKMAASARLILAAVDWEQPSTICTAEEIIGLGPLCIIVEMGTTRTELSRKLSLAATERIKITSPKFILQIMSRLGDIRPDVQPDRQPIVQPDRQPIVHPDRQPLFDGSMASDDNIYKIHIDKNRPPKEILISFDARSITMQF